MCNTVGNCRLTQFTLFFVFPRSLSVNSESKREKAALVERVDISGTSMYIDHWGNVPLSSDILYKAQTLKSSN